MKYDNEITVEVDLSLDELINLLLDRGFKKREEYTINDIYMVDKNCSMETSYLEVLKHCILIREIRGEKRCRNVLTYKYKEFNEKNEIIKQGKINVGIDNNENAKEFFETIGYKKLVTIKDEVTVFEDGNMEFCVQHVNNKHVYIEIEQKSNYIDKFYSSTDEIIKAFNMYNIPIKRKDYFVKKAEIELKEKYGEV